MEDERKTERKRKRFAARLKVYKGILSTEIAGPNIVLCNAGRATGVDKKNILGLIKAFSLEIQPPKYIAEKGQSHSFLVFQSTENAVTFFNACHGKVKDSNGTPLYLNFVENVSVPETEIICRYDDPKGLTLLPEFITQEEETQFIELFDWTSQDANSLKNRLVKHYGYEFRYGTNDVDLDSPLSQKIPPECDMLWKRLEERGFHLGRPDQMTVNKYSPGHGIPSHVDRHSPFGDTILSLSLGSSVVMDWKHHSGASVPVVLPTRSMLVMQGEARYDWQHGIQHSAEDPIVEYRVDGESQKTIKVIIDETRPRKMRISLTFRWTRSGPCECGFKTLCDSGTEPTTELDDSVASHLEELHVHQVYEQIASHFSSTRHTPWPRVVQFVRDVTPGTVMLDLGAGNGKNVLRRNDILQIAGERSSNLLSECVAHTSRAPTVCCVRLDALHAGLRDGCADVVICIAVLHHISTKARRLQAISTIHRLLRQSGRALITVWAKDQSKSNYLDKNKVAAENLQVNVNGVNLHVHENRTQFQHRDLLVPWNLNTKSGGKCRLSAKSDNQSPKSGNKSAKSDNQSAKSGNQSAKSDNQSPKSGNQSAESDNQSAKSGNQSAKSDNPSAKSSNQLANSDNQSAKSGNQSPKSDNQPAKSNSDSSSKKTSNTLLRFYHVFEDGELDGLCQEVGFEIESNFYEEGNWCVICKKVQ